MKCYRFEILSVVSYRNWPIAYYLDNVASEEFSIDALKGNRKKYYFTLTPT